MDQESVTLLSTIKDWLVPLSTFVTLLTASIGGWLSLKEFRLKVRAERRLAESSEIESDIKLLKLFTEVVSVAHARGGYQVSEKAIEAVLTPEILQQLGISSINLKKLLDDTVVSIPVGIAEQDSAISAVWALGRKYDVLTPVAIQALESLSKFKHAVAEPYLLDLKNNYNQKILAATEDKNYT